MERLQLVTQGKLEASVREQLIAAGKDLKDQLAVLESKLDEVQYAISTCRLPS